VTIMMFNFRISKDFCLWLFSAGYIYQTPVRFSWSRAARQRRSATIRTFSPTAPKSAARRTVRTLASRACASIRQSTKPVSWTSSRCSRARATSAPRRPGKGYGMSGRGLAIDTAQPPADEFPIFRSFWLVKPEPGSRTVTVFALLDSVSVAGAYKFVISAGSTTIMDIECTLFPRAAMPYAGIAPLTSMFYFAPGNSYRADEARLRVHDSDGLAMVNGKGEHLWRPLINPTRVQYSAFADGNVKGFGLVQRERRADHYQDIDALYEARPSVWVEPKEGFGEGAVELVELPTKTEYFDNIVAFWAPP